MLKPWFPAGFSQVFHSFSPSYLSWPLGLTSAQAVGATSTAAEGARRFGAMVFGDEPAMVCYGDRQVHSIIDVLKVLL